MPADSRWDLIQGLKGYTSCEETQSTRASFFCRSYVWQICVTICLFELQCP